IQPGASQTFQVRATSTTGTDMGDVTGQALFTIAGGGSCNGAACTSTTPGDHQVRAAIGSISATATLTVTPPPVDADLAVSQSVSNPTPAYGSTITFTTVVTNQGPAAATGVTVSVPLPSGVQFASAPASYQASTGTWTIGSLANGAHATLDI